MGSIRNHYEGCMLGLAIGDALGWPVEFMKLSEIRPLWLGRNNGLACNGSAPARHIHRRHADVTRSGSCDLVAWQQAGLGIRHGVGSAVHFVVKLG
ncbi:MAG: ADP-ribosylglycohydrolase family protein [Planctomycetes bacterium]|nr:ADP-ribosylglycohydrolase family protein [Planctomycetota bacterium]